jgi:glycosyltransferase involved in cell wall biosynthesis
MGHPLTTREALNPSEPADGMGADPAVNSPKTAEMKVCLFADGFLPTVGGMELAIHNLANALCDIHCDVTVIAKNRKGPMRYEKKYRLTRYGNRFPGSGRSGADFLAAIATLLMEHRRRPFDVINCHTVAYAGNRAAFANRFLKVPLVMTPHGEDIQRIPEINYGYRMSRRWDRIIRRNLAVADAVTAISDSVRMELDFLADEKVFVIPNGIDTKKFPSGKSHDLHDRLSIDRSQRIVLSVGRNDITKGYPYGIEAFRRLAAHEAGSDLVYVIVGKNSSDLAPLVRVKSLQGKVHLLPQQDADALLRCYQSAWCFFSPSITEGLSLVSIEAMATGLPLVVTDVPGNVDMVRENGCGLIVKSKDPESMARGILALLSDPNGYNRFSGIALRRAASYDWRPIARKYVETYRRAALQRSSRRNGDNVDSRVESSRTRKFS